MTTWLETLKIEIERHDVNDFIEPLGDVRPKEHEVGEADEDLRRLFSLGMQFDRTSKELLIRAIHERDPEMQARNVKEACEMEERSRALFQILWISLKDSFSLWDKPSVGIRKGWKIVWFETDEHRALEMILGSLLG